MSDKKIKKIKEFVLNFLDEKTTPVFIIPLLKGRKKKIKLFSKKTAKTFVIYSKILSRMYMMIIKESFCTKRDIFYENPEFYKTQNVVNKAIDDISLMLEIPIAQLGVRASPKGLLYGKISFCLNNGVSHDCTENSVLIPEMEDVKSIKIPKDVMFLVIEKEATFRAFIQSKIEEKNIVLVCGKGYPCVVTRKFLNFIEKTFRPRIGLFVDFDPHGYRIALFYKIGDLLDQEDKRSLTINTAKLIGIRYGDIFKKKKFMENVIELTKRDRKIAENILKKLQKRKGLSVFKTELMAMLNINKKAEIQSICCKETGYLPQDVILEKIEELKFFI